MTDFVLQQCVAAQVKYNYSSNEMVAHSKNKRSSDRPLISMDIFFFFTCFSSDNILYGESASDDSV